LGGADAVPVAGPQHVKGVPAKSGVGAVLSV
jgi:hypothetical protein